MVEFLKKAMDWVLEKEAEAAKKCAIDPSDVEKQIKILEAKRAELRKKFEEEDAEFGHVLTRLALIKANASKCEKK
ncbi:hypothetical protein LCX93_02455 [Sulfurimonas sp. SWIR-19]|uniref:hypothetical protein n=1 Tax=Sulfurimonas sp. SWIR-19 TaxID=2878390 RepID=UPI001CF5CC42|nr:hypothetical protein [Sulfurimonas sp. SWIR-19]UCN00795.1 hypothetical protein LCX93_02455 [Sulfurimonas sp. SWIR-19]